MKRGNPGEGELPLFPFGHEELGDAAQRMSKEGSTGIGQVGPRESRLHSFQEVCTEAIIVKFRGGEVPDVPSVLVSLLLIFLVGVSVFQILKSSFLFQLEPPPAAGHCSDYHEGLDSHGDSPTKVDAMYHSFFDRVCLTALDGKGVRSVVTHLVLSGALPIFHHLFGGMSFDPLEGDLGSSNLEGPFFKLLPMIAVVFGSWLFGANPFVPQQEISPHDNDVLIVTAYVDVPPTVRQEDSDNRSQFSTIAGLQSPRERAGLIPRMAGAKPQGESSSGNVREALLRASAIGIRNLYHATVSFKRVAQEGQQINIKPLPLVGPQEGEVVPNFLRV